MLLSGRVVAGLSCWAPCVWGRGALGHPVGDTAPHSTKAGASLGMKNVLLEGQTALRCCMDVVLMPAVFTWCPGWWARMHFYPQRWSPAGFSQQFLQHIQPLLYLLLFLRWRKLSKVKASQEYRTISLSKAGALGQFMLQEKLQRRAESLTSLFLSRAVRQINKQTPAPLLLTCCACAVCFFRLFLLGKMVLIKRM